MNDRERLLTYYVAPLTLPRPRNLCVNATLRCNGRCGHCGIWRTPAGPEFATADLARALASPFFSRIETAWITGGEPTLRPDFDDVARALCASLPGLTTLGVATNALDPERVEARVQAMLAAAAGRKVFVQISTDGVGPVHDHVRHCPGAFAAAQETLKRLERLRREGAPIDLGLNCVIQPANLDGLDELFRFAKTRDLLLTFNVALVTDQVYRNRDRAEALVLDEAGRGRAAAFLAAIAISSPPALAYHYRIAREVLAGRPRSHRCLSLYSTVNINADGTLIPCPASSDLFPRNALTEDMDALWKSAEAAAMRARVRREFCPGCMLSCSLGDSMPLSEWLWGGWDGKPGLVAATLRRLGGRRV